MRKAQEPTIIPPLPQSHSNGERKSQDQRHPPADERPIRPAVRSGGGGGGLQFASGRSSYNLDFVDWENEWENHVDMEIPEGGYEVEDEEDNDRDNGINWVEEYHSFWNCVDAGQIWHDSSGVGFKSSNWNSFRVNRLQSSIEERGGLAPMNALELQTCKVSENNGWLTETNNDTKGKCGNNVVCGICLENMNSGDLTYKLCHPFHVKCIRPWFMRSQACPMCRGNLWGNG